MLTIRSDQMKALGAQSQAGFVDRLLSHLAAQYPSWCEECKAGEALSFVQRAIEHGEKQNIRGELAVAKLAELMLEFGENLERSPDREWAVEILAHPTLPDRLKVTVLSDRLRVRTAGKRIVELDVGEAGRPNS